MIKAFWLKGLFKLINLILKFNQYQLKGVISMGDEKKYENLKKMNLTRVNELPKLVEQKIKAVNQFTTIGVVEDVNRINELLVELCEDPTKALKFNEDPVLYLQQTDITPAMQELIVAGEKYVLEHILSGGKLGLGAEAASCVVVVVVVVVVV